MIAILIPMDYTPWLLKPELSKKGMLLALAKYVHEVWYRPEAQSRGGEIWTFDNRCSGDLESVATVLHKAGLTRYLDEFGRRSEFNFEPSEFEDVVGASSTMRLSTAEIEEAIIRLAEGNYRINPEIEWLANKLATKI